MYELEVDAEWAVVSHSPQPFLPYHTPLPVRMGRAEPGSVPPAALGNLEPMKVCVCVCVCNHFAQIPNFFHLTPPAIQKHCRALRGVCVCVCVTDYDL